MQKHDEVKQSLEESLGMLRHDNISGSVSKGLEPNSIALLHRKTAPLPGGCRGLECLQRRHLWEAGSGRLCISVSRTGRITIWTRRGSDISALRIFPGVLLGKILEFGDFFFSIIIIIIFIFKGICKNHHYSFC